jgi:hypothetical protein
MAGEKRIYGSLRSFPKGQNSDIDPLLLPPDQLSFATNATVRGDFVTQRPPFKNLPLNFADSQTQTDFQTGLFQGACYYRNGANGFIMAAVGGNLFQIIFDSSGMPTVYEIPLGASPVPLQVPSVPTGLVATAGNAEVGLAWFAANNATTYTVLRSTVSGSETSLATLVSGTSYTDTTAVNGTTYFYTVISVNAVGTSAASNEASASPFVPATAPSAPTNLVAAAGNAQVGLTWNASATAVSYAVLRSVTSGSGYVVLAGATALTVTNWTDSTAVNGTAYYYVVTATNAVGTSGNSNQASATPAVPVNNLIPVNAVFSNYGQGISYYGLVISQNTLYTVTFSGQGEGFLFGATGIYISNGQYNSGSNTIISFFCIIPSVGSLVRQCTTVTTP